MKKKKLNEIDVPQIKKDETLNHISSVSIPTPSPIENKTPNEINIKKESLSPQTEETHLLKTPEINETSIQKENNFIETTKVMLEEVNQESTPETIVEKVNLTPETTKPVIEKTTSSEFSFSSLVQENNISENKEKLSAYEINKKNLKDFFSCTEYR